MNREVRSMLPTFDSSQHRADPSPRRPPLPDSGIPRNPMHRSSSFPEAPKNDTPPTGLHRRALSPAYRLARGARVTVYQRPLSSQSANRHRGGGPSPVNDIPSLHLGSGGVRKSVGGNENEGSGKAQSRIPRPRSQSGSLTPPLSPRQNVVNVSAKPPSKLGEMRSSGLSRIPGASRLNRSRVSGISDNLSTPRDSILDSTGSLELEYNEACEAPFKVQQSKIPKIVGKRFQPDASMKHVVLSPRDGEDNGGVPANSGDKNQTVDGGVKHEKSIGKVKLGLVGFPNAIVAKSGSGRTCSTVDADVDKSTGSLMDERLVTTESEVMDCEGDGQLACGDLQAAGNANAELEKGLQTCERISEGVIASEENKGGNDCSRKAVGGDAQGGSSELQMSNVMEITTELTKKDANDRDSDEETSSNAKENEAAEPDAGKHAVNNGVVTMMEVHYQPDVPSPVSYEKSPKLCIADRTGVNSSDSKGSERSPLSEVSENITTDSSKQEASEKLQEPVVESMEDSGVELEDLSKSCEGSVKGRFDWQLLFEVSVLMLVFTVLIPAYIRYGPGKAFLGYESDSQVGRLNRCSPLLPMRPICMEPRLHIHYGKGGVCSSEAERKLGVKLCPAPLPKTVETANSLSFKLTSVFGKIKCRMEKITGMRYSVLWLAIGPTVVCLVVAMWIVCDFWGSQRIVV